MSADKDPKGISGLEPHLRNSVPTTPMTFGEQLVGLTFNPSSDDKVTKVKKLFAEVADILHNDHKGDSVSDLYENLYHHSIGQILNAQMNVVKVLTLKY